jgi:hypothetical protein
VAETNVKMTAMIVGFIRLVVNVQSSGAAAESRTAGLNRKMTNKSHKINRNWQGQRLLPAAPWLGSKIVIAHGVFTRSTFPSISRTLNTTRVAFVDVTKTLPSAFVVVEETPQTPF